MCATGVIIAAAMQEKPHYQTRYERYLICISFKKKLFWQAHRERGEGWSGEREKERGRGETERGGLAF